MTNFLTVAADFGVFLIKLSYISFLKQKQEKYKISMSRKRVSIRGVSVNVKLCVIIFNIKHILL